MPEDTRELLENHTGSQTHPRVWEILDAIARDDDGEGVIPVVGQGLLRVNVNEESVARSKEMIPEALHAAIERVRKSASPPADLATLIACILAESLGVPNEARVENTMLSQVVAMHPQLASNRYLVDTQIKQIYSVVDPEIPPALRRLAAISDFELFISTTPDDLLEQALNAERFDGESRTRVLSFAPTRRPPDEKIAEALNSGFPVVFQLFGRYKSPGCVALTESDYVDYMAALLDREARPRRLFSELKGKHLLLLGNSFQNWLGRFFLRLTKDNPFVDESGGVQYVADDELRRDKTLTFFLRHCAKKTEPIEDVHPDDFVRQLARGWEARRETRNTGQGFDAEADQKITRDLIFISYSRTTLGGQPSLDVARVARLADDLRNEGFKVWLDAKGGLESGVDYERKVRLVISKCGVFLPICSTTTQMRADTSIEQERPFFRREWNWALERLAEIEKEEPDRIFIIPIVVDDLPFKASNVPEGMKRLHARSFPEGVAGKDFFKEVQTLIRRINSKRRAYAGT